MLHLIKEIGYRYHRDKLDLPPVKAFVITFIPCWARAIYNIILSRPVIINVKFIGGINLHKENKQALIAKNTFHGSCGEDN